MSAPDFSTTYMGMHLPSPLVASPSPRTGEIDFLREVTEAGAGAVVLPSLFEEQIVAESQAIDRMLQTGADGFGEAATFFPELSDYNVGPDAYLDLIRDATGELDIPVIASLNGTSETGWIHYASLLESAGAAAVELNTYQLAADPAVSGTQIEDQMVSLVAAVRRAVSVPLAVKIGPFYSSVPHLVGRLADAGANAVVLFNRFYQPDLNLETLEAAPRLTLSSPEEVRLPLRWIGLLSGRVDVELAATTGVHSWEEAAKVLLAGATVAMMTSALLRHGPGHVATVTDGLREWMVDNDYDSVAEMTGSAAWATGPNPTGFERANYLTTLTSYSPTGSTL